MQGDPASGSLWAFSMDPLLRALRKRLALSPGSESGVCADDVGLALSEVKALKRVHGVFYAAEVLAGLQLKIPKCCIVPLEAEFSPELRKSIEALLAVHVPSWKSMPVAAMAEYLGVWIGPAANMEM
eukprot:8352011-Pyramimonas_sp.AAC.1